MKFRHLVFLVVISQLAASAMELPRHEDYPVRITPLDRLMKPNFPKDVADSRGLYEDLPFFDSTQKPNFAHRFTFFDSVLIDRTSGRIYPGLSWWGGFQIDCRRDSRLLIIKHGDGLHGEEHPLYADCYVLKGTDLVFLGRWATTFGAAEKKTTPIDWHAEVAFDPVSRTRAP